MESSPPATGDSLEPATIRNHQQAYNIEYGGEDADFFLGGTTGGEINSHRNSDEEIPSEKPLQSAKEKNREHARNTRQRKKDYIESLKEAIKSMSEEMERTAQARDDRLTTMAQQNVVLKRTLQMFFYYRATAEMDREKWAEVLEEDFTMLMPITPYRSFSPSEVQGSQRFLQGIDSVILDSVSLNVMLQSIVPPPDDDGKVIVQIFCAPDECVMVGNTFMGKWHMSTMNAVQRGCLCEVSKCGMLKVTFSPISNKLVQMEESFDVMNFMQQLRQASGKYDFFVVPNTPLLAQEDVQEARIIIDAAPPHIISFANHTWAILYGHKAADLFGHGFEGLLLHSSESDFGSDSDSSSNSNPASSETSPMAELHSFIKRGFPCSTVLTIKAANGYPVRSWARLYPLYSMGKVSQFMVVMQALDEGNGPNAKAYPTFTTKNLAANSSSLEAHRVMLEAEAAGAAAGALAEAGSSTQERYRQRRNEGSGNGNSSLSSDGDESSSMRNHAPDRSNSNKHSNSNSSKSDTSGGMASTISSKSMNPTGPTMPMIQPSKPKPELILPSRPHEGAGIEVDGRSISIGQLSCLEGDEGGDGGSGEPFVSVEALEMRGLGADEQAQDSDSLPSPVNSNSPSAPAQELVHSNEAQSDGRAEMPASLAQQEAVQLQAGSCTAGGEGLRAAEESSSAGTSKDNSGGAARSGSGSSTGHTSKPADCSSSGGSGSYEMALPLPTEVGGELKGKQARPVPFSGDGVEAGDVHNPPAKKRRGVVADEGHRMDSQKPQS